MDPVVNPYTPNAGAAPLAIVGRDDQLMSFDLLLRRMERGMTEQSMLITGLRGVGKTVLLGQFRSKVQASGWVALEMEVSKHDDTAFRRLVAMKLRTALLQLSPKVRWGERGRAAVAALKSFTVHLDTMGNWSAGIDVDAAEGVADHDDLSLDLTDVLVAVGEAAAEAGKGVVVLLDEVQFLSPVQLESLIQAIHKVVQRTLPVTLVGVGLPQLAELAGDAKSYAERLFKFPSIGNLDDRDARLAFTEPAHAQGVAFSPEALDAAVALTGGYPYFVQELGYAVWSVAEVSPITRRTSRPQRRSTSRSLTHPSSGCAWTEPPSCSVPIFGPWLSSVHSHRRPPTSPPSSSAPRHRSHPRVRN